MKVWIWIFRLFVIGCLAIITTLGIAYCQYKLNSGISHDLFWFSYGIPFPFYEEALHGELNSFRPLMNVIYNCAFYAFMYLGVLLVYLKMTKNKNYNPEKAPIDE